MSIFLTAVATIASMAVTVTRALAVVGLAVQGLKTLGNALMGLAKAVGLIKSKDVDELGDKALQAEEDGIKPENYNTYDEYVRAVEDYDVNPEKSKMIPEEKKVQKGMELVAGTTIERFKDYPIVEFFDYAGKNPEYFTEDRMRQFGELVKEDGSYIENFMDYVSGAEKNDIAIEKTMDMLKTIEKTVNPNISDREALKNITNMRIDG